MIDETDVYDNSETENVIIFDLHKWNMLNYLYMVRFAKRVTLLKSLWIL